MAIDRYKAKLTKEEADTPGGTTYHVILPGSTEAKTICFRPIHGDPDHRCEKPAGYDTWHLGTGACKFHGGATEHTTFSHGRHARMTRLRLKDKISDYLNQSRDDLLDLTYELAASKAIFDEFLVGFPDPDEDGYGVALSRFSAIVTNLANLVDRISKQDSRNSLTAAQVLYLRVAMVDILMKYLPDPEVRERAVRELATRLGGDVEVNMLPSEISMKGIV